MDVKYIPSSCFLLDRVSLLAIVLLLHDLGFLLIGLRITTL
jgi:hypothetical protein